MFIPVRKRASTYEALKSYKVRFNGTLSSLLFFDNIYPEHILLERKKRQLVDERKANPTKQLSWEVPSRQEVEEFQANEGKEGGSFHVEWKRKDFSHQSNPDSYSTLYCGTAVLQIHFKPKTQTVEMISHKDKYFGGLNFRE